MKIYSFKFFGKDHFEKGLAGFTMSMLESSGSVNRSQSRSKIAEFQSSAITINDIGISAIELYNREYKWLRT